MSIYVPLTSPGHPTGMHREKFEEIRKQRGLDEKGFPEKREPKLDEDPEDPVEGR